MEDFPVMDIEQCTVSSFTFSIHDTDSSLIVIFCGMRMHIDISATNLETSPKRLDEYLHFLKVADACELNGLTVEDFYDWVLDGCSSTFSQLVPPAIPTAPSLADFLFPETRCYHLHADEHDTLRLIEHSDDPSRRVRPGTRVHEDLCSWCPSFAASQVMICADKPAEAFQHVPRKVRIEGHEPLLFFKPYEWSDSRSARHELAAYAKIRQADVSRLRISRLFGLVHSDSGLLLGLLLYHIKCETSTLQYAVRNEARLSIRQYWAAEVTETLTRLHEAGIIWGDAKPANILVDDQNDPWIIGFGGSYSQGWVEKEVAGTVEGDKQGLSKIVDYIFGQSRSGNL